MSETGQAVVPGPVLANLLGVSPAILGRLATGGIVARVGRDRYELWASVSGYIKHLHGRIRERKAPGHVTGLAAEKIGKTRAERERVEMENARVRSQTVSVEEVLAAFGPIFEAVRERILSADGLEPDEKDDLLSDLRGILEKERLKHVGNGNGSLGFAASVVVSAADKLPQVGG
jgi:phage terminase Nu1 subunit (DNA packaging protein)